MSEIKYVNLQPLTPTIPKGWRRLRVGSIRRKGDCFKVRPGVWEEVHASVVGEKINLWHFMYNGPYIRRSRPRKKAESKCKKRTN